jgi:hypothetical protein
MKKTYTVLLLCCAIMFSQAQVSFTANTGSGFGGPIGNSLMSIDDDGTTISIRIDRAGDLGGNNMVMYIANGATGRTTIDGNVNDGADGGRRAISNFGSAPMNFPPGFEATHAIAGANNFAGLFSIPAAGAIGENGLGFVAAVGNTAADPFVLTVNWSDLDLTSTDSFSFVVSYGDPYGNSGTAMFSSNEGYGGGITNNGSNYGAAAMTYTTYYNYPNGATYGIATNADAAPFPDSWSLDGSWTNGNLPSSKDEIIINHPIVMNMDVTVDNSLTINTGATVAIASSQVFSLNGHLNVTDSGALNFDSDASGSAQFINGPMATITGEVGVSRFIPTGSTSPRKAFRFIASSVTTSTSIYENWQTNGLSVPGIGTHITGSTSGANGFDPTATGNPSLIYYDLDPSDGTYKWQAISDTNTTTLTAGQPFNIFVRGDRNYDLSTAPSNPNTDVSIPTNGSLILDTTINSGPLNPNAGGFSFVGNPYQATIDMSTVTKNNINPNFVYIWNSNAATRGAYETVNMSDDSMNLRKYIQPGQAFFVSTIDPGPASLDFKSTDKTVAENALGPFSTPQNRPVIDLSLYRNLNGAPVIFDRLSLFLDGDTALDINDAIKLENFEVNLSRELNGTFLSFENRAMPINNESIPLDLKNISSSNYDLEIHVNNLHTGLEAYLHDSFLNSDTLLLSGYNSVGLTFDLNNPLSTDTSRFELIFLNNALHTTQIEEFTFQMYPNPTSNGKVIIKGDFTQGDAYAIFFNTIGQIVLKADIASSEAAINVQSLDAGIYLVKVISENNTRTKKLVIN